MSEFLKRTLSGAVYVGVVIGSVLWHPVAFGIVFLIVTVWGVSEYHRLMGSSRYARGGAVVGAALMWIAALWALVAPEGLGQSWGIYALFGGSYALVIFACILEELWAKAANPVANWGNLFVSQMMIALPFCSMIALLALDKWLLLALFVLIWVNDSGAYCVGSLTAKREGGNHKMFPRVSPKKSWEGLFGGFVFAILAALLLQYYGWFDALWCGGDEDIANNTKTAIVIIFAILACTFGTLGDLLESLMKRTIGVKDSGRFLPGHGGVLDRFDSMLLAAPMMAVFCWVCYAFLSLC
jgi:phosphatidate cytidylyltransferase